MIALRLYRVLPKHHRLRLLDVLPPHRRLWLVRRFTRKTGRRTPAPLGSILRVRDVDSMVRAVVVDDTTPAMAWRRNIDQVVAVLDAARIDYFALRHADQYRSAVAVAHADRTDALQALRTSPLLQGAVVRTGDFADNAFVARAGAQSAVQVHLPVTDPLGRVVLGSRHACEVEFWRTRTRQRRRPRHDHHRPSQWCRRDADRNGRAAHGRCRDAERLPSRACRPSPVPLARGICRHPVGRRPLSRSTPSAPGSTAMTRTGWSARTHALAALGQAQINDDRREPVPLHQPRRAAVLPAIGHRLRAVDPSHLPGDRRPAPALAGPRSSSG